MQTFLPYADYSLTAQCLDMERLSKQRIEAAQVLGNLLGMKWDLGRGKYVSTEETQKWINHPCVQMWSGHEGSLYEYLSHACAEYTNRGRIDGIFPVVHEHLRPGLQVDSFAKPGWIYTTNICSNHRSILLGKDRSFYLQWEWTEKPAKQDKITGRWPYVWPTKLSR